MLKITIEGSQDSSKTTAASVITKALTKSGYLVVVDGNNDKDVLLVTQKRDVFVEARKAIMMMPSAVSGSGGHQATFVVARKLVQDFALSDNDAWNILVEYNKRCEPPWSEKELLHKLESAKTGVSKEKST
jgi:hypothetical protein